MLENLKAFLRHGRNEKYVRDGEYSASAPNMSIISGTSQSHRTANGASSHYTQGRLAAQLIGQDVQIATAQDCSRPQGKDEQNRGTQQAHQIVGFNQGGDYHDVATQIYEEEKAESARESKYPGLENYEILGKTGEGAFSVVFKARHLISSKIVAIKVLRKFQMDHSQKQAALKEVTIMRQLKHPNIIRFIEVIESESYYYIVQELAVGGEIFAAIVNFTYLSEDLSRHIIYQVAEAVRYLHEEVGIVHRDIKPENLLFQPITFRPSLNPLSKLRRSDDLETKKDEGDFVPGIGGGTIGVVKLVDFGLSKQIWEHKTKTPCGTVGYTAPEIVLDKRYSKEVDMWAIGCVLYTLLCGFPPFYDERIECLTEKVAHGNYTFLAPWWDEISDGAKNCVLKLLIVDPKKRYTINDLLGDPWLSKAKKPIAANLEQPKSENGLSRANFAAYQNEALFSPAALALREAFDISAAVHRAGEEAAFQKVNVPDVVIEECDDTDTSTISNTVRDMNNDSGFALNLGFASILERRKNKPDVT